MAVQMSNLPKADHHVRRQSQRKPGSIREEIQEATASAIVRLGQVDRLMNTGT